MIFFAARNEFGHFHGVFVRFGAAHVKNVLANPVTPASFFAEQAARLRGEPGPRKTQLVDLFLDGFEHLGMLVANI